MCSRNLYPPSMEGKIVSRKDILLRQIVSMEQGLSRIKKALNDFDDDLEYSTISYSRTAMLRIRNMEMKITGEPRSKITGRYDFRE